jgi:glycosyltransferase involved in cell wall biosynthesis
VPLRITIVTGFFLPVPAIGGGATERSWYGLARIFAAAGHSVTFVSRDWATQPPPESVAKLRHVRLRGFDHSRFLPVNLFLDLVWGLRVTTALPRGDVVVCNTIFLPIWLSRIRGAAGKVAVMIGRAPKGQVAFYDGVDRIYAPSSYVARELDASDAEARVRVIGYPIDWPTLAQSARQKGKPVIIGFAGRIHPEKGIELLIRAAILLSNRRGIPEWRLRIVGPTAVSEGGGSEQWVADVRKASAALGDRVEWLPAEFAAERLAALYGSMDVFCYPSLALKGETFGVAVAEAMAASCAVVVSSLGCFGDLVAHGETGLIFDHSSPDSDRLLSESLERLVADPALRRAIATRGQQHVRRFDYAEVSTAVLQDLAFLAGAETEKRQHSVHV